MPVDPEQLLIRPANFHEIPAIAAIRALDSGDLEGWQLRISGYFSGTHHPQQALPARIAFVALRQTVLAGFVAGHLTRRYDCHGEL